VQADHPGAQIAFKAPSLRYQSTVPTDGLSEYQGIDPDGAFETQREKHRNPRQSVCGGLQARPRR